MTELVFLFSADADIQRGYEFYEKYQEGRGDVLLRHLGTALGYLRKFPEMAPVFHNAYRRMLVPGFPYGIFYALEGQRIVVAAVLDLRQNPQAVLQRLDG